MFGAGSLKGDFANTQNVHSANHLGKLSVAPRDTKQCSHSSKTCQRIMN